MQRGVYIGLAVLIVAVIIGGFFLFSGSSNIFSSDSSSNSEGTTESASEETSSSSDDSGLGNLCSGNECFLYCQNNMQECIDYCMQNPSNELCQQFRSGSSPTSSSDSSGQRGGTWDLEEKGVPQFITHGTELSLDNIDRISKFRSAAGHDYSGDLEECRSMKHYIDLQENYCRYMPDHESCSDYVEGEGVSELPVIAPANATIIRVQQSQGFEDSLVIAGVEEYPAFMLEIHHVNLKEGIGEGDKITAGQEIGVRTGETLQVSEFGIAAQTPEGRTYVSYFNAMTDEVFQRYKNKFGVSRNDFIITKEERDTDPLTCEGKPSEQFTGRVNNPEWSQEQFEDWASRSEDNWVYLS